MSHFPFYKEPILPAHIIGALDRYYEFPFQLQVKQVPNRKPIFLQNSMIKNESDQNAKHPLKILITTFWNYPHQGGLSNYIKNLTTEFERMGHSVDVMAPNSFNHEDFNAQKQVSKDALKEFFLQRYDSYSQKILQNCVTMHVYEWFLSQYDLTQYDLISAQDIFTANIISNLNQLCHKPLFLTPHGLYTKSRLKFNNFESHSVEEAYFREIERHAYSSANKIITISNSFHSTLIEYGALQEQLTTVHSGINFPALEKKHNPDRSKTIITCISRLSPRKGHSILFEALDMIKKAIENDVEVWIVGDGEMKEELEKQKESLKLEFVQFLGMRSDIPEILSESDVFVLPTINDNFPISIVEAMFAEQAIISTNCGGIPEMIQHGETGLITEPGNAEELAVCLLLLLKNIDVRQKIALQAKKFANDNLTSAQMANKIMSIYKSFLSGGD